MSKTCGALLVLCAISAPAAAQQPAPAARPAGGGTTTLQLSMDQAVTMALETNLGLKADRLGVNIASENVALARSAFRPVIRSSFSRTTSDQLPSNLGDAD